jgi:hypothetical protein
MAKISRADILRELVEDVSEGYTSGKHEWRNEKKHRSIKSLRESKESKEKYKQRRARQIQRSIRRGEFDFAGSEKQSHNSRSQLPLD